MSTDLRVAPLLRVAIFQGLTAHQISEIARRAERIMYRDGDVIAQCDEEADAAILIVAGTAVRIAGPELSAPMEPVPVGAMIAEMAMLVDTEHSSTIVARGPIKALRLTREAMLEHLAADPDLAERLVSNISGRLHVLAAELRRIDQSLAGSDANVVMTLGAGPAAGGGMAHASQLGSGQATLH